MFLTPSVLAMWERRQRGSGLTSARAGSTAWLRIAVLASAAAAALANPPGLTLSPVFPPALKTTAKGGQFVLDPSSFEFVLGGAAGNPGLNSTARLQRAVARFREYVFDYGPAASASAAQCCGQTGTSSNCTCDPLDSIVVRVDSESDVLGRFTDEAYNLSIAQGQGAQLNATTVYGAMRGLQTFSQLVKFNLTSATYTVFGVSVVDAPRFEYRGVMADTSRNFVSLAELRTLCDLMEQNKMNALHLHLTDDQSWPIEIDGYPRLTQWLAYGNQKYNTAANMTTDHVFTITNTKALVSYCQDRAVRIIPEVDMPGHFEAQQAYPEYFVTDDNPHGCAQNASEKCGRGMIDITSETGFGFVEDVWKSLIDTFPSGEYHIGGDEVWMPPWSNSTQIQNWMEQHKDACPDDPKIKCGTLGDLQPYFTRRVVGIIEKHSPGAQVQAWNPGVGSFFGWGNLGTRYPNFTYSNWQGPTSWQGPMSTMTDAGNGGQNGSVILSGPFYVYDPDHPDHEDWEQMMHTDILNFTGGDKSKVRGAELTAWGDAAKIDSGNTVFNLARYMSGMAINLWSPNGTVAYVGPLSFNSCNGDDYSICDTIDWHRCTNMMRGLPGGERARGFGVECSVPFSPQPPRVWWRSPKLPPAPPPPDAGAAAGADVAALRQRIAVLERENTKLKQACPQR